MVKKLSFGMLAFGWLLLSAPAVMAQEKDKDKEKEKYKKEKEYQEKDKDYRRGPKPNGRYDNRGEEPVQRTKGKLGGILGRVILPPAGTAGPRQLEGVPKGHYPPPGQCRIWYPNRPPGQQPPPRDCGSLAGVRLEPGAFILHGDRAYDAEYDWQAEERRRPGSVGRDVLDILFPRRR